MVVEMLIGLYRIYEFLCCSFVISLFFFCFFSVLSGARSVLPMGVAPEAMVGYL
jgi:hypothetical protein